MKRTLFTIFKVFCFLILMKSIKAQTPLLQFSPVLDNDGKSLKKINCITQDSLGYMWFAGETADCLYKFDGVNLTRYPKDDENPNALSGGGLQAVCAGRNGEIWIGVPGKGLDLFFSLSGRWKHYQHNESDPNSLGSQSISVIIQDKRGRVWVGTEKGLDELDPATDKFTHFRNNPGDTTSLSDNSVRALYEDRKGVIWVGTGFPFTSKANAAGGLNRLEPDGRFKRYQHHDDDIHSLANNKVGAIFEDSKGNFWVGTAGDGLHLMDRETGIFQRYPYDSTKPEQLSRPSVMPGHFYDFVSVINEDGSGAIWIGSYRGGLNRYDPQTKKISHFGGGKYFPDSSCWSSCVSRDGVFWLCTEEGGLYRVDPYIRQIPSVQFQGGTRAMWENEKGELWAGTTSFGYSVFNIKNELLRKSGMGSGLFGVGLWSFLRDSRGIFWVGTDKGIGILDPITDSILPFGADSIYRPSGRNKTYTLKIIEDKSGTIWFATSNGLLNFFPNKGIFQSYANDSKDSLSLPNNMLTSVIQDENGTIWASCGVEGGVARLNSLTGKFTIYLKGRECHLLFLDSENTIWALNSEGLFRSNSEKNQFLAFFDPISPYSKQNFTGATEDHEGNLWFDTIDYLLKLNKKSGLITCYDSRYGKRAVDFFDGGSTTRKDGRILVGNGNGYFSFYPGDLFVPSTPLHLRLTQFELNNVEVLPSDSTLLNKPIEITDRLALNYNQNNIGFRFSAFDYRDPNGVQYYTRLDGLDNIWRETKGEKIARYFDLSPGNYVFRVKAFYSGGKEEERIISIEIAPPFWKTKSAYFLYALASLGILVFLYRAQKKRIIQAEKAKTKERELARAKEVEKAYEELKRTQAQLIQSEKMASLGELTAGIAHEIQNPLNFVNNFSEVNTELIGEMKSALKAGDIQEALTLSDDIEKNLSKIGAHGKRADSIVKGMLQHSRGTSGNKELTDINALCEEWLRLAYHGMRAREKDFNVKLKTEFDPALKEINIDPQDLGRVILNIFNNAFYAVNEKRRKNMDAYEPEVVVKTIQKEKKSAILIRDNGMGIPEKIREKIFQPFFTTKPTGQGTGLGLSLSYDSIKAMGGEIRVESKEGEWTEFLIELPA